MQRTTAIALCTAIAATPATAADTYVLDAAHTHIMFKVERFGLSNTIGSFVDVAGEVTLDEEAPENSKVEATIKVASIDSDNATREEHVSGPRWLDAAQFPEMTFRSTKVERTGEKTANVIGELTIREVTKPVTLTVTLRNIGVDPVSKRKAAGFSAKTKISRLEYGVTTAENLIGSDVEISIEALGVVAP